MSMISFRRLSKSTNDVDKCKDVSSLRTTKGNKSMATSNYSCDLIVDWPSRRPQLSFDLDRNTTRVFERVDPKSMLWYDEGDKNMFKKDALRDAQFFKRLANSDKKIDPSLYEDKVCAWGLENILVSYETAVKFTKSKKKLRKAVWLAQELQEEKGVFDPEIIATASRRYSEMSRDRAQRIGGHHERAIKVTRENDEY